MSKQIIETEKAPAPIGPYNQAIVSEGELIFTAGQIALDPKTGEIVGETIQEQTRQVMENLKAIIEAAGSSLGNTVKTTIYLKDMNDFPEVNAVYGEYFSENSPARSTIEVSRLPKDVMVEIDCIALLK